MRLLIHTISFAGSLQKILQEMTFLPKLVPENCKYDENVSNNSHYGH